MAFPLHRSLSKPARAVQAWHVDAALVALFSLVITLAAQIAIPLPFTPVPVTLQTLAVLLAGALLGPRRGALAVLAYIGEGLAGLPVFAGGKAGIAHLLGPTGGFLAGFVAAAFLVGLLAWRGWTRKPLAAVFALSLGNACLYVPGLAWLGLFVGYPRVLSLGFLPFLPGDVLKIAAGGGLLSILALARGRAAAHLG